MVEPILLILRFICRTFFSLCVEPGDLKVTLETRNGATRGLDICTGSGPGLQDIHGYPSVLHKGFLVSREIKSAEGSQFSSWCILCISDVPGDTYCHESLMSVLKKKKDQ